jgi:hypothetical protein
MSSRLSAALLSATASVALSFPAAALEPEAAAQALATALAGGSNAKVTFDGATQSGDDIVVSGLTVADSQGDGIVRFAETIIENPTEGGTGIFDSPRIAFNNGAVSGESTGSIGSAALTEVSVLDPATVPGKAPGKGVLFKTAEATDIKLARKDQPGELTVARVFTEVGNVVDNLPQDSKGSVEDVTVPPEFFAGADFTPQSLGYDKLVLDVTWDGSRDVAAKTMTVRDFTVSIQEGGELSFQGVMGNLPDPTVLNDADAPAKANDVEVHTVTVRYEEESLAGRILDWMAQKQGITRADYANQIAAALPFLLAAVNNPEFRNELAGAVGTFLKDPQSLTLKIEPPAPISGEEIMKIAGSAPQSLPDRLNASVTANTPNTPN